MTAEFLGASIVDEQAAYKEGDTITFLVTFTEDVDTTAPTTPPQLELSGSRNATFIGTVGTDTLAFEYTVGENDNEADLEITGFTPSNSIQDASDSTVVPQFSTENLNVVLDTIAPAAPTITLDSDTGASDSDGITNDGSYTVTPSEGGTIEYSTDDGATWVETQPDAAEGSNTIMVRETDAAGNISDTSTLSFTLDTMESAPLSTPDLVAASDTGVSDSDDITSSLTPGFAVDVSSLAAGDVVTVTADGLTVGSYTVQGDETGSVEIATTMTEGAQLVAAYATDVAGNVSPVSPSLAVTIDATAPMVQSATFTGEATDGTIAEADVDNSVTLVLTFDGNMDTAVAPSVDLGGAVTSLSQTGAAWSDATTYTITYTILDQDVELEDILIAVSGAQDVAGNVMLPDSDITTTTALDTTAPGAESETVTIAEIADQDAASTGTPVTLASLSGDDGTTYALGGTGGVYDAVEIVAVEDDYELRIIDTEAARGYFDLEDAGSTILIDLVGTDDAGNTTPSTITVNLTNVNDAPEAGDGPDSFAETLEERADDTPGENATPFGTSGSFTVHDDDVSDTHSISFSNVTAGNIGFFEVGFADVINGDGNGVVDWAFTIGSPQPAAVQASQMATVDALAAGQSIVQVYNVTVTETNSGEALTYTRQVTVTIAGTNDGPVISGEDTSATLAEVVDDGVTDQTLTASGSLAVADVDTADSVTVSVASVAIKDSEGGDASGGLPEGLSAGDILAMMEVAASGGEFGSDTGALDAPNDGTGSAFDWQFTAGDAETSPFDYLTDGEVLVLEYTLSALDDSSDPAGDEQVVTITITGSNDAPVIAADTVAGTTAVEAGGTGNDIAGTEEVSGELNFLGANWSDADAGETAALVVSAGSHGADAQAVLSFDGGTGNEAVIQGTYGTLYLTETGGYRYELDDDSIATQMLNGGEEVSETFNYTISNGPDADDAASATLTVNVTGANDTPEIIFVEGEETGTVEEAGVDGANAPVNVGPTTATGVFLADDLDAGDGLSGVALTWSVEAEPGQTAASAVEVTGIHGSLAVDQSGNWTFTLNNDAPEVQALHDSESVSETFVVAVADDSGATTTQTVMITINGTNDAPLIAAEPMADTDVTEAGEGVPGDATASGSFTSTDVDTGGDDETLWSITAVNGTGIAPVQANGAAAEAGGTYGSLSLDSSGNWIYTLNDDAEATQALDTGDTGMDVFTVRVADGLGGFSELDVTVNVSGSNDAPVITVEAGDSQAESVEESDSIGLSASGTITLSDVDAGQSVMASVTGVAATGVLGEYEPDDAALEAMLSLGAGNPLSTGTGNASGQVAWTFNSAGEAFDFLAAGESIVLAYAVEASDGAATDTDTITVTVTGTNDRPEITSGDSATLTESTDLVDDNLEAAGTLSIADADASDTHTVSATLNGAVWDGGELPEGLEAALAAGELGAFSTSINEGDARQIDWSFSLADTLADFLAAGETLTVTYDVTVNDGTGFDGDPANEDSESAVQQVTITINGSNDVPTITAGDIDAFDEGNALEIDEDSVLVGPNGAETVTVNLLGEGTDTGGEIWVTDVVELDTNDTRAITGTTGVSATGSIPAGFVAADAEAAFDLSGASGGAITFDRNAAIFDALDDGESIDIEVSYQVTTTSPDGTTTVDNLTTTIRINGANDAPYIIMDADLANAVTELPEEDPDAGTGNQVVTGGITFNDVDPDDLANLVVQTTAVAGEGDDAAPLAAYVGTMQAGFLTPTGTDPEDAGLVFYTFTINDGVLDNLAAGETFTQSYNVSISDGTATTTRPIVLTFTGTNDAPEITGTTGSTALSEDAGVVETGSEDTQMLTGTISFDDVDTSTMAALDGAGTADTHSVEAEVTGVTRGGTAVMGYAGPTGSLTFDVSAANASNAQANTAGWTYQITDGDFDFLNAGEELAITYTVTVDDGNGGTDTQDITFTITGTNDAPVLAEVAAATLTDTAAFDAFDPVTGTLTSTDADDASEATYSATGQVASAEAGFTHEVSNAFGTLYLNEETGAYSFVADDNAVNALTASQDITFDLSVTDENGASDGKTLTITLAGANDAPVLGAIANGTITDTEDDDVYADVDGTFTSTDIDTGAVPTYSVTGQVADTSIEDFTHSVAHALGTLYLNEGTGAYRFVADDAAVEALSEDTTIDFGVTVTDDASAFDAGTLTIDVTAINDNPRGTPDADLADGTEDVAYTVSEADLLSGFADAEGDTLSVGSIVADNGATVAPDGEGGFIVTPADDHNGPVTLTYSVVDGNGGEIVGQTQTFHLNAVADPDTITSQDGNAVATDDVDAPGLEIALNATLRNTGEQYIDTDADPDGQTYVVPDGAALGTPQDDIGTTDDDAFARWDAEILIDANTDGNGGSIGDHLFTFTIEDTGSPASFAPYSITLQDIADGLEAETPGAGADFLSSATYSVSLNFMMEELELAGFDPEAPGTYRLTVTATDLDAGTPVLENHIDIVVNEAPVAVDDTLEATEDTAVTFQASDLLGDDTDGNGDTLTIHSVTAVSGGTVELNEDGSVTFTPDENFNGAASFTYVATDGQLVNNLSNSGTVTVNVAAVNDDPVLQAEDAGTVSDTEADDAFETPLTGTLTATDVESDGSLLSYSVTGEVVNTGTDGDGDYTEVVGSYGTLRVYADGSYSFEIDAAAVNAEPEGTDITETFDTAVADPDGGSATSTLTVTIDPANDTPELEAVPGATIVDTAAAEELEDITGMLSASDRDTGDAAGIVYTISGETPVEGATSQTFTFNGIELGTLTVQTDGSYSFDTNDAGIDQLQAGETPQYVATLRATDSGDLFDETTLTIDFTGANDNPVVIGTTPPEVEGVVSVTAQEQDQENEGQLVTTSGTITFADADSVNVPSFGFVPQGAGYQGTISFTPSGGTVASGTVGWNFSIDDAVLNSLGEGEALSTSPQVYDITINDGNGGSVTQTVSISIVGTNDAPVIAGALGGGAVADSADLDEAADGAMDATIEASGTLSVSDEDTNDNVTVSVTDVAVAGTFGGTLPLTNLQLAAMMQLAAGTAATTGFGATAVLGADGAGSDFTWAFGSGASGDASFDFLAVGETLELTYELTADDGSETATATDTQTVTVTITGTNDSPTVSAAVSGMATEDDAGFSIDLLENAADVDLSDTLSVANLTVVSGDASGVTENGNSLDVDPSAYGALAVGESEVITFSYDVEDGNGGTVSQTATITITGQNDEPTVAAEVAATASEDDAGFVVDLLQGAADEDTSDTLSIANLSIVGDAGGLTVGADSVVVDPSAYNALAFGEEAVIVLTYDIVDGNGGSVPQTATITITGANDEPTAVADFGAADENGGTVNIDVTGNDTDPDTSDDLEVDSVDTTGTLGLVTIGADGDSVDYDANGAFEYLAAGETATDTFTYTVTDANGGTSTATVEVTVTGEDDDPVAVDDVAAADEDGPGISINLVANDTDADASDVLTVASIDTSETLGSVVINPDNLGVTYDPDGKFEYLDEGESVEDTFTYTVTDGAGVTSTATVTVTINGQDDDPLAVADSATVSEDGPAQTINLTDNDTDADENDVLSIASVDTTDTQGSVTINEDGVSVEYDPNGAFESLAEGDMALDTFTYEVTDGDGLTSTETVTVTITGVNDDPNAVADSGEADEDGPSVTINLVANDTDVDTGDVLSIASLDLTGTLGAVTIDAGNESVTYDATGAFESLSEGETAEDTFSYTVTDSNGGTATQTVTVTITGRNDAPVVTAITEGPVSEDDGVRVIDLLDGQTDIDANDTLSVQNITVSDDTMAMVAFTDNGDGTIGIDADQYDSLNVGESRTVTVNYEVFDGTVAVANTATLVIEGRNDAPVVDAEMSDLAVSGDEDTTITGTVVATDPDATGTLSYSVAGMDGPANGSVLIDAVSGEYTYTPDDDFNGSDSFTVTITDDQNVSVTQVINVTVDPVNDASEIDVGAQVTAEHTEAVDALAPVPTLVAGDVTVSDVDGLDYDGGVFTASVVTGDLTDLLDLNQGGIVTISGTDVSVDGTVIGTISGQGSSTLSVTFNSNALAADVQAVISELTYATTDDTPVASRDITLDLSDGDGASAVQQTVSVDITASNDSPLANDDAFGVNEGAFSSTVNVLTRAPADSDPDGDTLSVTQISDLQDGDAASGGSAAVGASAGVITTDLGAEVTLQDDGQLFYNLSGTGAFNALAAGETAVDSFTYTVSDGNGGTDTATVSVTITGVNDAIVAKNDSIVTTEDDADTETGNILDNDVDVDTNDTRSIVNVFNSATATAIATAGGFQITTVDGIVIQLASDGSYTMTAPDDLASGEVATASFLYTVQDGGSAQSTATVTVEVTGNNDAPVVDAGNSDLVASGDEDTAITGTILATDADAGAVLTYSVEEGDGTANGSVSIDAVTGEYTYTPDADFNGSDSFTVTITDDQNVSVTHVVSLTVDPVNDAPEVDGPVDLGASDEDVSLVITEAQLLATASDVDGDDLSVSGVTVSAGTVVDNMDGTWTFTPAADDDTEVTFTFAVSDGTDSTAAMATLDLLPVNDAPVVDAGNSDLVASGDEDTAITGTILATDADAGAVLTYSVEEGDGTANGSVSIDAVTGEYTYTPDADFNGSDSFTVTITDDQNVSVTQVVSLTVDPVNDAPEVDGPVDLGTSNEDVSLVITEAQLLATASDVDGDDLSVSGVTVSAGTVVDNLDGTWTFTPAADDDTEVTFTFAVSDGTDSTAAMATLDLLPVNDPAVVGGDISGSVTENANTPFNGVLTVTDVDGDDTSFVVSSVSTTYGAFMLDAGGAWSYTLDEGANAVERLVDGQVITETFEVFTQGGVQQQVTVTINGTTDLATPGNDTLVGTGGADFIEGLAGDDDLNGLGGDDTLDGGDGNDTLNGSVGADSLIGGSGNDNIDGADGDDFIDGGDGNDVLFGGDGDDELVGGDGDDRIRGDAGNDTLSGGAGSDDLRTGGGNSVADGGLDNDTVIGGTGMDTLRGGDGDDLIKSASGNDSINGDGGDDIIRAGADNDIAHGDDGNDLILGQGGDDELMGGAGQDRLLGGSGKDTLDGGSGDDTLSGGGGNDELDGGEGDDRLYGDVGDDILFNSAGQDRFEGGSGADTFVFDDHTVMGTGAAGRDLIFDFEDGIDVIDVSQMDADPSTAGIVDTFTFVGASGFTGTAGEIQISSVGSHTALDFDFDGDAVADGTILLRDFTGTITEDDFLF